MVIQRDNQQRQSPVVANVTGEELAVTEIFYSIQGEGPFSGQAAIFIRLSGCNLQCPFCDTLYDEREKLTMPQMRKSLQTLFSRHPDIKLIVITGGEPFRQNVLPLLKLLHEIQATYSFNVQFETNGTIAPPHWHWTTDHINHINCFYIVVSPKTPKVHKDIEIAAFAWKYIVAADLVCLDGLPTSALGQAHRPARPEDMNAKVHNIYVIPEDDGVQSHYKRNLEQCVEISLEHQYTLQIQLHKHLGIA